MHPHISSLVVVVVLMLVVFSASNLSAFASSPPYPRLKLSGIIIPGFASSQLRAWAHLDCPFSPLGFKPLDLVWLDTRKVYIHTYIHTYVYMYTFPFILHIPLCICIFLVIYCLNAQDFLLIQWNSGSKFCISPHGLLN